MLVKFENLNKKVYNHIQLQSQQQSNKMGPRNSTESKGKQQQFLFQYEIIQEIVNQNIRFLEHKQTKKQYLLRQINYNDQKQYLKAIQNIKIKKQQLKNADHITAITDYFSKEVDGYCGNFYKIYILFEYPQRTLDDQINQRNLRKNNFSETQIWSILASCILGLGHLQRKSIKHSSLKSSMIFLSHEGFIKISDPFTTGCQTNYETLLNKRGAKHIYLSPEQCQALQNQIISPAINSYKSDIFTLGMIILQCGLLQYQDQCYRDQCSRIHWQTLQYNKNRFRKTYSQELANMLEYMLGAQSNNRPQWIELENYVITDNTGKSFISEGRKSALLGYSKPVSVNINKLILDGSQSIINTVQKPMTDFNIANSNVVSQVNKGLRMSSSKSNSIQKINYQFTTQAKRPQIINQFRTSTLINGSVLKQKPVQSIIQVNPNSQVNQSNSINHSNSSHVNLLQSNFISSPPQPLKISESSMKSQIRQSEVKRFDVKPLNPSNINMTRPFKSIFPNPFYQTTTKADENLIELEEDDEASQTVSASSSDHYRSSNNRNFQFINQGNTQTYSYTRQVTDQSTKIGNPSMPITTNTPLFQVSPFLPNFSNTKAPNNLHENYQRFEKRQFQGQFVIQTFKLGSRYEGYKLNGMRHGPGKFYYQDGGMYDGNWVRNKMQGIGRLYYQSGKLAYEGEWIQDQFKGHGILYNQNPDLLTGPYNYENFDDVEELWTKYEGQFDDDSKNGKGILYLSNGEYFEGSFMNDTAEGSGVYTTTNGHKIYGIWENNNIVRQM